jgi:D-arginine dehydrogenase
VTGSESAQRFIDTDVIVVGAGIAGASIAYFLARHANVVVLEREPHVGVHATGRSAALFLESYGSAQVRALTRASRAFLSAPPPGFAGHSILSPRGTLTIGGATRTEAVSEMFEAIRPWSRGARLLDGAALRERVPVLLPEHAVLGVDEPGAADIDVHELHQGYLRGLRVAGGGLHVGVDIRAIERVGLRWEVETDGHVFRAPSIVNAAGAWVDEVARLAGVTPIGVEPRRRSAFLFAAPPELQVARWPMVMDIDEAYYFKPDAGLLLGSCANADLVAPHDVQPEELDIALGIHHIEQATTLRIRRPTRIWAGLRSFAPSGDLVGGFAPDAEGFFWLAGQGGYGIQTSAAMGQACACLVLGRPLPAECEDAGLNAAMLAPAARSEPVRS